ncbi:uncharacterized protein LOC110751535 [Prunus avium]|uniref:Uncharacterized protein LOC110751535 n=1 Tax=Prunus avium TaxID=42229 RepID=A0A6P5RYX2_PRUAV|nr:uncharacterized protein LOC110751535 [Prunus avium]
MEKNYWTMYFDGSSTKTMSGAGVVIESPQGQRWQFAFQLDFKCTNNQTEYEALIIGLGILKEMKATRVLVYGDSQLVINQLTREYQCTSENLTMYYVTALNTADEFSRISFVHVPRAENHEANEMAQVASGMHIPDGYHGHVRCTNNQTEYEALIISLGILKEMKATRVLVYGDSQLVINQLTREYQCTSENLTMYYVTALNTADEFSRISFVHVPRAENHEANEMAQVASGMHIPDGYHGHVIRIERRTLPALAERGMTTQMSSPEITDKVNTVEADWRYPIVKYLCDPSGDHERTTRFWARCYLIYQNELYRKGSDGLLLLCPNTEDVQVIMAESQEGICSAHQSGIKMRWLVRRHGYYWPTILKDCIEYARGCVKCQIYDPIQRVPAEALHPITKPWPFRGWAVDIIGKIYPAASNQHAWILVATDYFNKWVVAESYRSISSAQVVKFFENHIVHRFGILETITADNGLVFASAETREYTERMGIKLVHSTPYYPQSNEQAEASNKLKVQSLRVTERPRPERKDYAQAMAQELEDLEQSRLDAYNLMQAQKKITARAYNRKVKQKTFAEGDLVWRAVLPNGTKDPLLPNGTKDPRFGKFSSNWEGPFIIERILGRGAFQLIDRDGERHNLPINGQYLKKYTPSLWETAEI